MYNAWMFERHQETLLRLINSPVLGRDMRQALWIDEDAPIVKIRPEAVTAHIGERQFRTTLYSNAQYAQALHHSFKWLWQTAHAWDMLAARRLALLPNLGFDTYSVQPDEATGIDTFIRSDEATTNKGTVAQIEIGEDNTVGSRVQRGLIKFDFAASIPPGASADSAVFSLWVFQDLSTNARTFRIYRQKRAWVETQATWNIYSTGNNWSTAGGFHADDCEQTEIASLAFANNESVGTEKQWTNFNLALLAAMWNGTFTNNGFLIKADTETNDGYGMDSSNSTTAGERPKMVIVWSVAQGIIWM